MSAEGKRRIRDYGFEHFQEAEEVMNETARREVAHAIERTRELTLQLEALGVVVLEEQMLRALDMCSMKLQKSSRSWYSVALFWLDIVPRSISECVYESITSHIDFAVSTQRRRRSQVR
jgi:hypothetical protein